MGGSSRPGSSRAPTFSDDQKERKIPTVGQQDSRAKHLAVKTEARNEPAVREGIYTAKLMYIRANGNESSGPKLNSIETVKMELGKVIGGETGYLWKSLDAKEWYHAVRQKIFRHALLSPFEAMGMITVANGEKEPMFQTRPGTTGRKDVCRTQHHERCGASKDRVPDEEGQKW